MKQLKITQSITSRNYPAFEKYLTEISRIPMITPDEEVELAERIQQGDKQALDKLVCANLRFVVSVAKQYERYGMNLPDLVNDGNVGLIKAAQKFDHTRGFKFISYAVWWIRQSIFQAIADQSRIVRIPLNQVGAANKVKSAIQKFIQDNQRQASPDEIAEILDMPVEKVIEAMSNGINQQISIDQPATSDEDSKTPLDVMDSGAEDYADAGMAQKDLQVEVNRSLAQLPDKERSIVQMVYGIGQEAKSLDEIASEVSLTRERVRQIRDKALIKLKGLRGSNLRVFL